MTLVPDNFRQILSRARRDLYQHLRGNCSLVEPGNSCRCARKTRAFVKGGYVDPEKLQFTADYQRKVRNVAGDRINELSEAYMQVGAAVYRNHPFYEPPQQADMLKRVLQAVSMP
jgi:hypothetical protein